MEEPNELLEKKTREAEHPWTKKPSPSSPPIETPDPPREMDPSAPPGIQKGKPLTPPGKRKRIFKTHVKLVMQTNPKKNSFAWS